MAFPLSNRSRLNLKFVNPKMIRLLLGVLKKTEYPIEVTEKSGGNVIDVVIAGKHANGLSLQGGYESIYQTFKEVSTEMNIPIFRVLFEGASRPVGRYQLITRSKK